MLIEKQQLDSIINWKWGMLYVRVPVTIAGVFACHASYSNLACVLLHKIELSEPNCSIEFDY